MVSIGIGELVVLLIVLVVAAVTYAAPLGTAVALWRSSAVARAARGLVGAAMLALAASVFVPLLYWANGLAEIASAPGERKSAVLTTLVSRAMGSGTILYVTTWALLAIAGVVALAAKRKPTAGVTTSQEESPLTLYVKGLH